MTPSEQNQTQDLQKLIEEVTSKKEEKWTKEQVSTNTLILIISHRMTIWSSWSQASRSTILMWWTTSSTSTLMAPETLSTLIWMISISSLKLKWSVWTGGSFWETTPKMALLSRLKAIGLQRKTWSSKRRWQSMAWRSGRKLPHFYLVELASNVVKDGTTMLTQTLTKKNGP